MKRSTIATLRPRLLLMMICMLLAGVLSASALMSTSAAEEVTPLTPADLEYENGNIVLHKHGERIGPDEWKVTVKATVGAVPVEKRTMEVVFLLDISSSMNTDAHDHTQDCYTLICGETEHEHTEACYNMENLTCGLPEHTHGDACYVDQCDQEEHTHSGVTGSCYAECTPENNEDHWYWRGNRYRHFNNTDCVSSGGSYYYLTCTLEEHTHSDACKMLVCEQTEHVHTTDCAELICQENVHTHTSACYSTELACGYTDTSRFGVAMQAAERLISHLPEGTEITRLAFDGDFHTGIDSYYNISTGSGTYMWTAIRKTLNGSYFSTNDSKKIFVILTDGEASYTDKSNSQSAATTLLNTFKDPDGANGSVFTVGFAYDNDVLEQIAGNGGYYMYAEDARELTSAFEKLEQSLTAMLEDPMGTTVGFEKTSIQEIQASGGVISSNEDTIYWHPAEDGSDTVSNSTIAYSYTVQLNEKADLSGGNHTDVPLNNPTNFLYGIKDSGGITDMKSAAFPIPKASYAISSIQTKWQANGQDIRPPTEVESIFCDYASATYIPAFTQDYQTITPTIPISGTNDYYRYIGTTVTADDASLPGVEAVDATEPVAYVVIHQYERVKANELVVGGTKTLIGRDFLPGDSFTFQMTAVTPGAPMPANDTVTITPTSGTSMAFRFDNISFNTEGVYTYTIQELDGALDKVIYDTAVHTLVVTAQLVDSEIVVSYTMDGVSNGHLMIQNRVETGTLKVEKRTVTSHLPEHQEKAFGFLIHIEDVSDRPLNGDYQLQTGTGEVHSITFTNGYAAVTLKAGESAEILGLPDGAAYTVTEDAAGGFTVTSSGTPGAIAADQQSVAAFDNAYQSTGLYQFIGLKTLEGAELERNQFSFSILDEQGQVVGSGKNNADGGVFLDTLYFTQDDIGTKTYTIVEDKGSDTAFLYDPTQYVVTLTIADKGDGTLSVTDDLNGGKITFVNKAISHQLVISKQVAGSIGSRNKAFSFTLSVPDMAGSTLNVSTDNGATFQSITLDAQGETTFSLMDSQSILFYPVSGAYTVTETDAGSYITTVSVDQGAATEGTTASGSVSASGSRVDFVNTLDATIPTGVDTPMASAILCLCLAVAMMAISMAGRRLVRDED